MMISRRDETPAVPHKSLCKWWETGAVGRKVAPVICSRNRRGLLSRLGVRILLACVTFGPQLLFPAWPEAQNGGNASRPDAAPPVSTLLDQAKQLVQQGDPQAALNTLDQVPPHGPHAADAHTLRGICLALLQKPIESAAEFDQAIALRPNYAPSYLSSGLAYATFNNLDRALERLAVAVKLAPNLPGVRYNYALVLARAGKYPESEKQVELELANKEAKEPALDLWRLKARDAYYQKKWQDALDAYNKALALDPQWVEAYAGIGEALYSLNRSSQESLIALQKAESLDPQNETPHALLGRLYQDAGQQNKAIEELETAHRLAPSDREVTYRLYRIYGIKGDTANADRLQADLETLLASNHAEADSETKAMVLNNTGIELEKKGDMAGALEHYEEAAKTDVSNLVFQRNAALVLCKTGRPKEAIRRLEDILSLDPDDAETLQILAVANEVAAGKAGVKRSLPAAQTSQ
jgi:tetratricopeptide (TPR) repeat protein